MYVTLNAHNLMGGGGCIFFPTLLYALSALFKVEFDVRNFISPFQGGLLILTVERCPWKIDFSWSQAYYYDYSNTHSSRGNDFLY